MKIGLALGGGGARGFAHIGILQEFEKAGIQADVISGTSIGALVGAVYANDELETLAKRSTQIRFFEIPQLLSPAWSLSGVFSGKNTLELLKEFVHVEEIEDLALPYAAVAADFYRGKPVTLTTGSLLKAIRASIAIPLVFTPVEHEDSVLVDGGMLEPVPVEAARNLGADFVIAIDLFGNHSSPNTNTRAEEAAPEGTFKTLESAIAYLRTLSSSKSLRDVPQEADGGKKQPNYFEMLERSLAISQQRLTELRLADCPADLVLQPQVADIGLLDFHRGEQGIDAGRRCATEMIPVIKKRLAEVTS